MASRRSLARGPHSHRTHVRPATPGRGPPSRPKARTPNSSTIRLRPALPGATTNPRQLVVVDHRHAPAHASLRPPCSCPPLCLGQPHADQPFVHRSHHVRHCATPAADADGNGAAHPCDMRIAERPPPWRGPFIELSVPQRMKARSVVLAEQLVAQGGELIGVGQGAGGGGLGRVVSRSPRRAPGAEPGHRRGGFGPRSRSPWPRTPCAAPTGRGRPPYWDSHSSRCFSKPAIHSLVSGSKPSGYL